MSVVFRVVTFQDIQFGRGCKSPNTFCKSFLKTAFKASLQDTPKNLLWTPNSMTRLVYSVPVYRFDHRWFVFISIQQVHLQKIKICHLQGCADINNALRALKIILEKKSLNVNSGSIVWTQTFPRWWLARPHTSFVCTESQNARLGKGWAGTRGRAGPWEWTPPRSLGPGCLTVHALIPVLHQDFPAQV